MLTPHLRHYEWGSKQVIPEYFGWKATDEPVAEVWLGAHPKGSSLLNGEEPLSMAIQADSLQYLGLEVHHEFQGRLPFLMKFLAADSPLSIQVHPNLTQAQLGFAKEEVLNIPESERNYLDPFDKPEQICAISEMWALAGFRTTEDTRELCGQAGLSDALSELETASSGEVFLRLLKGQLQFNSEELISSLTDEKPENQWVRKLSNFYRSDPAALAPFFMNLICLKPGQAMFVKAGMVHAYLSGFGVEVMGASDNVLRSGLTRKKMDMQELEKIVSLEPMPIDVIQPMGGSTKTWHSDVSYFKLHKFSEGQSRIIGPAIIACTEGSVSLIADYSQLALQRGEFAFLKGDTEASIQGMGSAFFCTTNVLSDV
jgi:mannose-6-phosphate isomerase